MTGAVGMLWFMASLIVAHFLFWMFIAVFPDSQASKALTAIGLT
jgi:hypothetical protein